MIVQKTSLDPRLARAGSVAMATSQGLFDVIKGGSLAIRSAASYTETNHLKSTVNFGDQSPREIATATAITVHDITAGEHTRSPQRISHHWRGIDFSLSTAQNIKSTAYLLGKKSYLLSLKRARLKNLIAA